MVQRVIRALLDAELPRVVVVGGAHIDAIRQAMSTTLDDARVHLLEHQGWAQGQLSSLLAGLDAIDDPQLEAAVVTLVDVPLVSSATVATVIDAWRRTRAPIVRPASGERHGHPVVFDRHVFADLRAADPSVGAKAVFAIHKARVLNVEVHDSGAFEDIDTPEDYQRVLGART